MSVGQVTITKENLAQGSLNEIERTTLFIGLGATGAQFHQVHVINQKTDLDTVLGAGDSALKTQIKAAALNAGENFTAYAIAIDGSAETPKTWAEMLELALDQPNNIYPEKVALCDALTTESMVSAAYAAAQSAAATFAKYITIHAAVQGISNSQTWSEYIAAIKLLNAGKAYDNVYLVPNLHGNNLGVVIGRLDNENYSLGDSPMRVASGPLVGLGSAPVDKNGEPLTMAHITELESARFSVPQWYTGFDGIYWADHRSLDAEGGDFQVYENLRAWQYAARRVRVLAIRKIADRSLNSSGASINYHRGYFLEPILNASKSTFINGLNKPGLFQKPIEDDCQIIFKENEAEIVLSVAPYGSTKKITASIALDLKRNPAE